MFDRSLFDQARAAVSIDALAASATDLRRAGGELRGQCPLCGAGKAKSAGAPFAVKPAKGTWRCYVCDAHGDVVDLERELRGGSPVEAARRLVGPGAQPGSLPAGPVRPRPKPEVPKGPSASDRVAEEILREARPFAGSPAERYMAGRGIGAEVLALIGPQLRFHPNAKWGWDEGAGRWIRCAAMIAPVVVPAPDGTPVPTGGVHATYLAPGGKGKAALDPAKRMWGPQGADGKRGVAWLAGDPRAAPGTALTVGEGIETVASVLELSAIARAGCAMAALSLDRLQGGILRDDEGRVDVFSPEADPERPPATWPGRWRVIAAVDRDMGELRVKGRTGRRKPCDFTLDGEARARLCARLALRGWMAAGAMDAKAIQPGPGCDFNDELRRRQARTGAAA